MKKLLEWLGLNRHELIKNNRRYFKTFDKDNPFDEYEYVVLDTELTGLDPRTSEVVSIGAVRVKNLRIMIGGSFFCYARPSKPLPKNSTLIHRITPQQIEKAPPLEDSLPKFIEYCHGAVLVGHFLKIDLTFLGKACRKHFGATLGNTWLDTLKLSQSLEDYKRRHSYSDDPVEQSFNLNKLAIKYNLPLFEKHDALEDAIQTAYLFIYLAHKLRMNGCVTLRDLLISQSNAILPSDQGYSTA
ncbi:MAG: PolC-type DNA polymerase III [Desulfomonilaceae bacterium]